jgi:hypothetical protein
MGFSRVQRAALVEAYFTNKSDKKCVEVFKLDFLTAYNLQNVLCMISSIVLMKLEKLTTGKESEGQEE